MTSNISCPNRRYTYICDVLNVGVGVDYKSTRSYGIIVVKRELVHINVGLCVYMCTFVCMCDICL